MEQHPPSGLFILFGSDYPPCANICTAVVGRIEGINLHYITVAGGMDKLSVSDVDDYMAGGFSVSRVAEKDQVCPLETAEPFVIWLLAVRLIL